jgi:UDP-N-acetylmuramoyl-tripeptide--D-alanyl-D-alanine ligase
MGDIKEICDLVHPRVGIVTSVGNMHLETFKTLQGVGRTKFELLDSLPSDGLGVINMDSEGIASYPDKPTHCRIITSAIKNDDVDIKAENVSYSRRGVSFDVCIRGKEDYRVETRLLGEGNILNVLVSLAVADHLGVSVKQQKSALASLQPVEHRLSISNKGGLTVLDDAYNSNPSGARMALAVLKQIAADAGSKGIVVTPGFVEMGIQQEEANRGLGRDIAKNADKAIIVNRYNRQAIVDGLKEGGFKEEDMYCVDSLDQAVQKLASICSSGDVVLYENDLPDTFK